MIRAGNGLKEENQELCGALRGDCSRTGERECSGVFLLLGNAGENISFQEVMSFHFDKRQLIS